MATQLEIWREEHLNPAMLTKIHGEKPSDPVVEFAKFLEDQSTIPSESWVADICCGKGRNSIYLGSKGYNVVGFDFVAEAIKEAKIRSKNRNLDNQVYLERLDVGRSWRNVRDDFFDAAIDCNGTIDIPNPWRDRAIAESYRTLKPGGYYLFYGVGPTSLLERNPGPEPNSGYFPTTGKFEKQYSKEELLSSYDQFELIKLDEIPGSDVIEGKIEHYPLWVALFRK